MSDPMPVKADVIASKDLVLDVLLYADVPVGEKPSGIPDSWPAKAIERASTDPVGPGYTRMTPEAYSAYRTSFEPIYQRWEDAIPPTPEEVQYQADQVTISDLRTKARDQWSADDVKAAIQIFVANVFRP